MTALVAALVASRTLPALPAGLTRPALDLVGVTVLMASLWITEAIPLAATSLIPLVAFPALHIAGIKVVAPAYSDRFILLLMGGFFVAKGLERWGLHKRLALFTVSRVGLAPRRLVLGFMVAGAGLSLWISNTATTLMMLPIAAAVLAQVQDRATTAEERATARRLGTTLMLGIAYSSSIGGLGTPIGTPPNNIFLGVYSDTFPDAPAISFFGWMRMAIPLVLVFLPLVWWYLVTFVGRLPRGGKEAGREAVEGARRALGRMSTPEKRVAVVFALTAAGWIFREPIPLGDLGVAIPGWAPLLGISTLVDDSTVAMAGALLLFMLPAGDSDERLLDWGTAVTIPWGLLLLFGGGIAIAAGFKATGLSAFVGQALAGLTAVPPIVLLLLVALVVTFLTEVTSNTATANILLPIMAATAKVSGLPPLALMLTVTLSASCAFMLPVATAPNAIVFGTGHVTTADMARAGFAINLVGAVLITLLVWFFGLPALS